MIVFVAPLLAGFVLAQNLAQTDRTTAIVDNINVALAIMKRNSGWSTGLGCMLSTIPGTSAKDLSVALDAVEASLWAYEISTRCGASTCPSPERKLIRQSLDSEFNQCVSQEQLEYNLKRRLSQFSVR